MSVPSKLLTRKWEFHRVYQYRSTSHPQNNRHFELTLVLEFPEDFSEYDVDMHTDEVVRLATDIMENKFFQKVHDLGYGRRTLADGKTKPGYDANTWTQVYSAHGDALNFSLGTDGLGLGRWKADKGYEKSDETQSRVIDGVVCEDLDGPRRIERFEYPREAWAELYNAYFQSGVDYEKLYRKLERYGASRADSLKVQYLLQNRPKNKCQFIKRQLTGEWVVVQEQPHHYDLGRSNMVKGTTDYDTRRLWR